MKENRMSREDLSDLIKKCIADTQRLLPTSDVRHTYLMKELPRILGLVEDHFPLTDAEKETVNVGLFAARELETFNEDFASDIQMVSYQIKYIDE